MKRTILALALSAFAAASYADHRSEAGQSDEGSIPLGVNDIPLGVNDIPLGVNDIPLGVNDIPLGVNDVPLGANDLQLGAAGERSEPDAGEIQLGALRP